MFPDALIIQTHRNPFEVLVRNSTDRGVAGDVRPSGRPRPIRGARGEESLYFLDGLTQIWAKLAFVSLPLPPGASQPPNPERGLHSAQILISNSIGVWWTLVKQINALQRQLPRSPQLVPSQTFPNA